MKAEADIRALANELKKALLQKKGIKNRLALAMGYSVLKYVLDEEDFSKNRSLFDIEKDPEGWTRWIKNTIGKNVVV